MLGACVMLGQQLLISNEELSAFNSGSGTPAGGKWLHGCTLLQSNLQPDLVPDRPVAYTGPHR